MGSILEINTNEASGARFSIDSTRTKASGDLDLDNEEHSEDPSSIYLSAKSEFEEEEVEIADDISEPDEEIVLTVSEKKEQKKSEEYKTGLFGAISVVICIVVGAGIFISPQDTFIEVKSTGTSLVIYVSLGMHTTLGAICFAELATTFPVSGGDYAYLDEAFGHYFGFQYQAMANLVFLPCLNAVFGQTVGKYLVALICVSMYENEDDPAHKLNCGLEGDAQRWTEAGIGMFFIILSTIGNFLSSRYTKKVDEVFMVGKLLGCGLIITLGVYQMIGAASSKNYKFGMPLDFKTRAVKYNCTGDLEVSEFTTRDSAAKELLNHLKAVYSGTLAYLGWNYISFLTKEMRNPIRDLPLAICISLPMVTAFYVMMNIGYMAVLDGKQFVCTKAMAYDMLNIVVGLEYEKEVGWIMVILVIMAALGGLFGRIEASCKSTVVGAQNHHWPAVFRQVHVTQLSPIPAVVFQGFMSLIYIVIVGYLRTHAILMSCYCENTFSALAVCGLVWMRIRRPNLDRPLKLWLGIPIFYCCCSFLLFLVPIVNVIYEASMMTEESEEEFFVALFVVCVPVIIISFSILSYILCISKRPCPKFLNKANHLLIKISRKLCRLMKQPKGDPKPEDANPNQADGDLIITDVKVGRPSTLTFLSSPSHRLLD